MSLPLDLQGLQNKGCQLIVLRKQYIVPAPYPSSTIGLTFTYQQKGKGYTVAYRVIEYNGNYTTLSSRIDINNTSALNYYGLIPGVLPGNIYQDQYMYINRPLEKKDKVDIIINVQNPPFRNVWIELYIVEKGIF